MNHLHIFGVKVYILSYINKEKSAKGQHPQKTYSKNLEKIILTQQYSIKVDRKYVLLRKEPKLNPLS